MKFLSYLCGLDVHFDTEETFERYLNIQNNGEHFEIVIMSDYEKLMYKIHKKGKVLFISSNSYGLQCEYKNATEI